MKASSTMLTLVVIALLLSSLHVASAALSAVSVFATVPLNPELRFTRLAPLAFNASLCSSPPTPSTPIISVRPSARLQPWTGAGAALTEATAYNFLRLKERNITAYHRLLHLLFASPMRGGIGLDLLRFPITASDMSLPTPGGGWSFDDFDGDVNLTHFNTKRASEYQIPALLDILQVARREGNARLKLFAAPWSIPAWMKDTKLWTNGTLREDLYEVYARYLARVVQTFHDLNAPFWAITLQSQRSSEQALTQQPQPPTSPPQHLTLSCCVPLQTSRRSRTSTTRRPSCLPSTRRISLVCCTSTSGPSTSAPPSSAGTLTGTGATIPWS